MSLIQLLVQYFCCRRQIVVIISIWVHFFLGHKTLCTKGAFNFTAEPCTPRHTNCSTHQITPLNFLGPFMKQNHHSLCAWGQHNSGYCLEYGLIFIKDSSVRLLWSYCKAGFCHIPWIWQPLRSGSKFRGSEASKFFSGLSAKHDTWHVLLVMICFIWQARQKESVIVQ